MNNLDPRVSLLAYLQPMRTLIIVPRPSLLDSLPRGKRPLGVCGGRLTSPKQPKEKRTA